MTARIDPMKAKLTATAFDGLDWIFERKFDGERAIVRRRPGGVRIFSRTGRAMGNYPELTEAFEAQGAADFTVGGEIVAFDGETTSFERLQGRMRIEDPRLARLTGIEVFIYVFDILEADGEDVTGRTLLERKRLLRETLTFDDPLRYAEHRDGGGRKFFLEACTKGWEGLVAKRIDSTYQSSRSGDWLKIKCLHGQELVIGGYTPPGGSRQRFGALLVGYNEDGELRYAGRVGTGFDAATLQMLGDRMDALRRPESPFTAGSGPPRDAVWIEPELVGEFRFSEWTRDGKLRHPAYQGLRDDKAASEVVRERPSVDPPKEDDDPRSAESPADGIRGEIFEAPAPTMLRSRPMPGPSRGSSSRA